MVSKVRDLQRGLYWDTQTETEKPSLSVCVSLRIFLVVYSIVNENAQLNTGGVFYNFMI